jgi:hypothetical protein
VGCSFLLVVALLVLGFAAACSHEEISPEIAYVSVPQSFIRDRVAPIYQKVATVHSGDRVQILDRRRRFALVRLASGEQGWLQERYLVSQQVYEVAHKLAETTRDFPVQATAVTRGTVNLHILPGRDSEHLYQLKAEQAIEVLKRASRARDQAQAASAPVQKDSADDGHDEVPEPPPLPREDWWLVRTADGSRAGWILGGLMYVDLPLDVAQYSEGARIVAFFVLNKVQDGDQSYPQYLVLYTDPKDGLPYDYNQARVFSWNTKRHRYETAFRERMEGFLPARVGSENFGREGTLPTFVLSAKNKQGVTEDRKYRLIGPVVRRVESDPQTTRAQDASRRLSARQ